MDDRKGLWFATFVIDGYGKAICQFLLHRGLPSKIVSWLQGF
jgi:hypothetical protein